MSDTVPATTTSISKPSARRTLMDLYLRKVVHPQARDNYRVILKDNGLEIEIGSIGIQHGSGATEAVGLGDRHRDPHERNRSTGHRQRPQGLHAAVWGGLGQSSALIPPG
jgi:hypothetical protein